MSKYHKAHDWEDYDIVEKLRHFKEDILADPRESEDAKSYARVKIELLETLQRCERELKRTDLTPTQRQQFEQLQQQTLAKNNGRAIRARLSLEQKGYQTGQTYGHKWKKAE